MTYSYRHIFRRGCWLPSTSLCIYLPVIAQTPYLPLSYPRQEEEGDDADISVAASISSHSIPLALAAAFPPLYGARYSETPTANTAAATYGGLVAMEDANDDDPESILDDHVQRVMKTPGCQSPGATNSNSVGGGRHSPPKSSRSPDGGIAPPSHYPPSHYPPHRVGGHGVPPATMKGRVGLFC